MFLIEVGKQAYYNVNAHITPGDSFQKLYMYMIRNFKFYLSTK